MEKTVFVPLRSLYDSNDAGSKIRVLESFSDFICKHKNDNVERFLKEQCIRFEDGGLARTYLAFDSEDGKLLGYFALAIKSIDLTGLSGGKRIELALTTKLDHSPAYLIGQLAKDKNFGSRLAKGQLLTEALSYIKSACNIVGGRVVYLDCEDNTDLINYYCASGFTLLRAKDNGDKQLFMKI